MFLQVVDCIRRGPSRALERELWLLLSAKETGDLVEALGAHLCRVCLHGFHVRGTLGHAQRDLRVIKRVIKLLISQAGLPVFLPVGSGDFLVSLVATGRLLAV